MNNAIVPSGKGLTPKVLQRVATAPMTTQDQRFRTRTTGMSKAEYMRYLSLLLRMLPVNMFSQAGLNSAVAGIGLLGPVGNQVVRTHTFSHHTGPIDNPDVYPLGLYSAFDFCTEFTLLLRCVEPSSSSWVARTQSVARGAPSNARTEYARQLNAVVAPPGVRPKFVRNFVVSGPAECMVRATPAEPGMHLGGDVPITDEDGTNMGAMMYAILNGLPVDSSKRHQQNPFTVALPQSFYMDEADATYYRQGHLYVRAWDFIPDYAAIKALLGIPVDYLIRFRWESGVVFATWVAIARAYSSETTRVFQHFDNLGAQLRSYGVANVLQGASLADVMMASIPGGPFLSMVFKEHSIPGLVGSIPAFMNSLVEDAADPVFDFPGALKSDRRDVFLGHNTQGMKVFAPGDKFSCMALVGVMGSGKSSLAKMWVLQKGPFIWFNNTSGENNTREIIASVQKYSGSKAVIRIGNSDIPLFDSADPEKQKFYMAHVGQLAEILYKRILRLWESEGKALPILIHPDHKTKLYERLVSEMALIFESRTEWQSLLLKLGVPLEEHLLSIVNDDAGSQSDPQLLKTGTDLGKSARGARLTIIHIFHTKEDTHRFSQGFIGSAEVVFFVAPDKSRMVTVKEPAPDEADTDAWRTVGGFSAWMPATLLASM